MPLLAFLLGGLAGWIVENSLANPRYPRYSKAFGNLPVPFLPVWGAGAAGLTFFAPQILTLPLLARILLVGAGLTALEASACVIDRAMPGPRSWAYGPDGSCVDLGHTAAWALLGTGLVSLVRR